ncbi:MAG: LysE/ArgO family amino acid transporter [Ktedonobacterales bacterium]
MMEAWLRGAVLGFSIAAPVGPIGVLCIRRTLASGRLTGLVSGLGAATADAFYGSVAAFGLTAVAALLTGQRLWLHLLGGAFLCYLGLRTLWRHPMSSPAALPSPSPTGVPSHAPSSTARDALRARRLSLGGAYLSTLGLTLTNPATILSFAVIFAGMGVASARGGYGQAAALAIGVFCGSALWWLLLSAGVGLLRERVGRRTMRAINSVSGLLLVGFGVIAIASR